MAVQAVHQDVGSRDSAWASDRREAGAATSGELNRARGERTFSLEDYDDGYLFVLEKPSIECSDVENLLGEYVESALPPTLKARVDGHVAGCVECQILKAGYEKTIALARELSDRPVPSAVSQRLRQALNAKLGIQLPVR